MASNYKSPEGMVLDIPSYDHENVENVEMLYDRQQMEPLPLHDHESCNPNAGLWHPLQPEEYAYEAHPSTTQYGNYPHYWYGNADASPQQYHYQQSPVTAISHESDADADAGAGDYIESYNSRDVLCGRGALMAWHPGNKAFRELVRSHREIYLLARRREKPRIANYIIEVITSSGGRFLREVDRKEGHEMLWEDIGYNKAYEKTTQALREGAPKWREKFRKEQQDEQRDDTNE
jgi:hypothetical protein